MSGPPYAVEPFPLPPDIVRDAITALHVVSLRPPTDELSLRQVASLPRPWDPGTCGPDLQAELWPWIGDVVGWINHELLWGLATPVVPECWPLHPHLCHDIAAVACERYLAGFAITPRDIEDWRELRLDPVLQRIREQIGHRCAPGQHHEDPRYESSTQGSRRALEP
ncbi:hypothetical protein [Nocardioides marmotae]|uniref:Uncharacterized protein n=1 Tax=Nocardioides marmotae TaxID=2663857 RepID=A0A6I3J7X0_9ACTN|nr:hypothetical protein [Nocardioides marmotae]MCR6030694.1 hypothetical protein [Gordonia jinghuaiqii]MBC9735538.1 hypothetical protein [Nocardioides marmotae]MTB86635.1 hypothetical protein [Nocardioides marmotae]MTB94329.1 hypothetical protein [Nocardioides marmotae]QKE01642.1 hypothetical protein HPC71_11550 [Nocardioides marmotae]